MRNAFIASATTKPKCASTLIRTGDASCPGGDQESAFQNDCRQIPCSGKRTGNFFPGEKIFRGNPHGYRRSATAQGINREITGNSFHAHRQFCPFATGSQGTITFYLSPNYCAITDTAETQGSFGTRVESAARCGPPGIRADADTPS